MLGYLLVQLLAAVLGSLAGVTLVTLVTLVRTVLGR